MMKQFPRRPETIRAIQYNGSNFEEIKAAVSDPSKVGEDIRLDGIYVYTNHGRAIAEIGDWIIEREGADIYPCKDEVFQKIADTDCEIPSHLPEHMKRVFIERHNLDSLISGLTKFLEAGAPKASDVERNALKQQHNLMNGYSTVLSNRLELYKPT